MFQKNKINEVLIARDEFLIINWKWSQLFQFRVEKQKIIGLGFHWKKVNGGAKELKQMDRRTNMNRVQILYIKDYGYKKYSNYHFIEIVSKRKKRKQ